MRSRGGRPFTVLMTALALLAGAAAVASGPPVAPGESLLASLSLARQGGPVEIQAKEVEIDYRTRDLWYRGNVRVRQGDVELRAERLHVRLDDAPRPEVVAVDAEGGVVVRQGTRTAMGERASFDRNRERIELEGRARLREGKNEVSGERVVVYLAEGRSVVEGGQGRVRAVLFPETPLAVSSPSSDTSEGSSSADAAEAPEGLQ